MTIVGFPAERLNKYLKANTATEGLAVSGDNAPLTAFELMQKNAEENERDSNKSNDNGAPLNQPAFL
jgi:hypothetical protein